MPIRCREIRRLAATWRHKGLRTCLLGLSSGKSRSAVRKRRQNFLPSAGRVCGSGICCQHRCCHCPRLRSFVEEFSERASTRKVARSSTESVRVLVRFTLPPLTQGALISRKPLRSWRPSLKMPVSQPAVSAGRSAEFIGFFAPMFRPPVPTKQLPCFTKPFSALA